MRINDTITANILHRLQSGMVDQNANREFCIFHGKNSVMQRLRQHIGKTLQAGYNESTSVKCKQLIN